MPTSVDVKNLKINKLTEAQYDTAVQGGVIGENELSVLTDLDDAIQVSSMPTASTGELGKVYQFIGTTDANYTHGYFYECVSDGQSPATYSWTQVEVQPAGSSLPDQTGQSGKFLSTDGTDASWADALVNNTTGSDSVSILGVNRPLSSNIVAIGKYAGSNGQSNSIMIGYSTSSRSSNGVAIGHAAGVGLNANYAIQLGSGVNNTNSDANTFKVSNANGNFEIMSADGTIPKERLVNAVSKPSTMPELTVAGWSNNTQTVTVTGVTATNTVFVSPAPASVADYASAGINCTAQGTDSLTFTCTTVPTNAITVNVVIMG